MELITARAGNLDQLLSFMRDYYALDGLPFEANAARAALSTLLADASLGRVWLVADGGAMVGYVVLTLGYSLEYLGRDAFVDELYLQPESRGRGLGAQALAAVEQEARKLGVRALHLEVERHNKRALALYERWGFRSNDRRLMTRRIDG